MPDPKEILGERLARGEISEEEYERLSSILGSSTPKNEDEPQENSPSRRPKGGGVFIGLGIVVLVICFFAYREVTRPGYQPNMWLYIVTGIGLFLLVVGIVKVAARRT